MLPEFLTGLFLLILSFHVLFLVTLLYFGTYKTFYELELSEILLVFSVSLFLLFAFICSFYYSWVFML